MNNVLSSVQMFEAGGNCNKYSKSVSYETLVGGTATTGRDRKQTQRLCEYCADKPLTAVGTLTSLLCNSAKVVEKFLQMSPVFRLIKIFGLVTVLSVGIVAESWADDITPTSGTCNTAGTCLWSLGSDGALTISAKDGAKDVRMANYNCDYSPYSPCQTSTLISRPWENNLQQIKSVYIGDNITHIGDDAFQNASNLTSVTGMKDVKTIGAGGVFAYTGLTEITIPDGVTYIGTGAFNSTNMKNVTLPDTINNIGSSTFLGNQAEINCLNTSGQCEKLRGLLKVMIGNKAFNIISPTSNCETYNNKGCTSCEKEYTLADGMCWAPWEKKHYTPAEAAKWLKEEDNTITITFKK